MTVAKVGNSEHGAVSLVTSGIYQNVFLLAPAGYEYCPVAQQELLCTELGEKPAAIGYLYQQTELQPGEVRISACGGEIRFFQTGDICINGVTITKEGELLTKQESVRGLHASKW